MTLWSWKRIRQRGWRNLWREKLTKRSKVTRKLKKVIKPSLENGSRNGKRSTQPKKNSPKKPTDSESTSRMSNFWGKNLKRNCKFQNKKLTNIVSPVKCSKHNWARLLPHFDWQKENYKPSKRSQSKSNKRQDSSLQGSNKNLLKSRQQTSLLRTKSTCKVKTVEAKQENCTCKF